MKVKKWDQDQTATETLLDDETVGVSRPFNTLSHSDNFQTNTQTFQTITSMYTNNSVLQFSIFCVPELPSSKCYFL